VSRSGQAAEGREEGVLVWPVEEESGGGGRKERWHDITGVAGLFVPAGGGGGRAD
jgi:hypothetical protein